ncbi:tRNA-uridine aminocarboxypropyltransferase [Vulgatibacter incomptus]|uniref:tRNA-uridine aminocarboxypropyltransferase n=1 Tax=Vulgatibacter incomptus TaxID=1391653 RepID=A0A0K1PHV3_9BACT|nr:tRNA-uridine aminocarboxypropyltransferase [Vulgatibacter incomptus]AKU93118.1 DTW domain protein [Vulgatibacter incomptus]
MSNPRPTCLRCRRPESFCWCRKIEPVATRTRLVFLQHQRESRVRIGTARIAHLALLNSEFHVGTSFPMEPAPRTAVLFPGEDALPPETLREGEPWTLIVVDGTWSQARKLVQRDPVLSALPRVGFRPQSPGNYRIRAEPSEDCLATVEAVAQVLAHVEGSPERFDSMIAAFTHMVDLQVAAANDERAIPRRKVRAGPRAADAELERLRAEWGGLVLLHAEANPHSRGEDVPGKLELLHLVALRPATGQRFEAVVAPRRPLAPDTPRRVGLEASDLLGGDEVSLALGALRDFLRADDVICTWGGYPLDLLDAEGFGAGASLDLRALLARRLGRRPGPPESVLGEAPHGPPPGRGRAGRTVATLEALVRSLLAVGNGGAQRAR